MDRHYKRTARHYRRDPAIYELIAGGGYSTPIWNGAKTLEEANHNVWEKHSSFIGNAENVLEIGPGRGGLANHVYQKGYKVTAIDISEEQVEFCKNRFPGIDFRHGTFEDISGSFDCIISSEMACHIKDRPIFWNHCSSLQKPGDQMFHKILHSKSDDICELYSTTHFAPHTVFDGCGFYYTLEEELAFLKAAGYHVEIELIPEENYIITMANWIDNQKKNKEIIIQSPDFPESYYDDLLKTWELFIRIFEEGKMFTHFFICTKL